MTLEALREYIKVTDLIQYPGESGMHPFELNQLWRRWVAHDDPAAGFELALLTNFFLIQERAPYPAYLGKERLSCPDILKAHVTSAASRWSGQRLFALPENTPSDRDYALQFMEVVYGKIHQTSYGAALRGFLHLEFILRMDFFKEGMPIPVLYYEEPDDLAIKYYEEAKESGAALYNAAALLLAKSRPRRDSRLKARFEHIKRLLEQAAAINFSPAIYCLGLIHDAPEITLGEEVVVAVNRKFAAYYYLWVMAQGIADAVTKLQQKEILEVLEPEQVLNLLYLVKRFSTVNLTTFAQYFYEKADYDFALLFMLENVLAHYDKNDIYDNLKKLIAMWEGRLFPKTHWVEINGVQYGVDPVAEKLANRLLSDNDTLSLSDYSDALKELKSAVEPFLNDPNRYQKLEKIERQLIHTRESLRYSIRKRFGNEAPLHFRLNDLFLEMSKYNSLTEKTYTKCIAYFSEHIDNWRFAPHSTTARLNIIIAVLEASSSNAIMSFLLTIAYLMQLNYEKAVECYAQYQFCQGATSVTKNAAASDLIALAEQALYNVHQSDISSLHLRSIVQSLILPPNDNTDEPALVFSKRNPFTSKILRDDKAYLIYLLRGLCEVQLRQAIDTRCEIETYCALTRTLIADKKYQQAIEKWEGYYLYIESCEPGYTAAIAYIIAFLYDAMSSSLAVKSLGKATTWALKAYSAVEVKDQSISSYKKEATILITQILIKKDEYQDAELWFLRIQRDLAEPLNNKEIVELVENLYAKHGIQLAATLLSTKEIDDLDCIRLLDTLVSYLPIVNDDHQYLTLRQPISERKTELEKAFFAGIGTPTTMINQFTTGEGFFQQQASFDEHEMQTIRPWQRMKLFS